MAVINKPNDLSTVWSSSGDLVKPTPTKIATGWEVEVPPRQWFNWLDNRQDQAIAHINQHGIPQWDSNTEYQADKSLVMGSDGQIYKAKQTNSGFNPVADTSNTYWTKPLLGSSNVQESGHTYIGGILIQWGTGVVVASGSTISGVDVEFDVPYTTIPFMVTGSTRGPANSVDGGFPSFAATNKTISGFTATLDTLGFTTFNQSCGFSWVCIGA